MITYEEALKKAIELKPNINRCTEYEKGYLFYSTEDAGYIGGFGRTAIAICKNGKLVNEAVFYYEDPGEEVGRRSI